MARTTFNFETIEDDEITIPGMEGEIRIARPANMPPGTGTEAFVQTVIESACRLNCLWVNGCRPRATENGIQGNYVGGNLLLRCLLSKGVEVE